MRGSAVLARANPQAATGPMPWVRSMATSTSAAVARIHGHRRRSLSTSAEKVTPAGRKRTAPVLDDSNSTKDVMDPPAYPAATTRTSRHGTGTRVTGTSDPEGLPRLFDETQLGATLPGTHSTG